MREVLRGNPFSPLFSWSSEAFLSAEDASQEQSSIDDPPSQVLTRKAQATTKKRKKAEVTPPKEPSDPAMLTSMNQGAIPKKTKRNSPDPKGDGQHGNSPNCGCHSCIKELCITKMISITPGMNPSRKLRDLVNKRRLFRKTQLDTHPGNCLCKTHLEKAARTPMSTAQKTTNKEPSPPAAGIPPASKDLKLVPPASHPLPSNRKPVHPEQPITVVTSR